MAKRRKNNIKKHSDISPDENSNEFMADSDESTISENDSSAPEHLTDDQQTSEPQLSNNTQQSTIQSEQTDSSNHSANLQNVMEESNIEHANVVADSSIGTFLKEARNKKGISLQDIATSTKIGITNLELLELDNFDQLPNRAYVTGYVKNYARVVGLSIDECMEELEKTYLRHGAPQTEPDIVIPQATNSPNVKAPLPLAKIATVAGILIAIIAIISILVISFNRDDDSQEIVQPKEVQQEVEEVKEITPQSLNSQTPLQEELEPSPSPEQLSDQVVTKEESDQVDQINKTNGLLVANDDAENKNVKEEEEESKNEDVKKETQKNKEQVKFYPLANTLYTMDSSMSEELKRELLPSNFRVSPREGEQNIFITANKDASWLTYKSDDDEIKKFVLKKGRKLLIRSQLTRLFLGNLNGVTIFLNNQPLKISSQSGVKSIVFPQGKSADYVIPLFIYKKDGSVLTSQDYIEDNDIQL